MGGLLVATGRRWCVYPYTDEGDSAAGAALLYYHALLRLPCIVGPHPSPHDHEVITSCVVCMLRDEQDVIKNVQGVAIGNGCWGTLAGTNCGDVGGHPGTVYKIDSE